MGRASHDPIDSIFLYSLSSFFTTLLTGCLLMFLYLLNPLQIGFVPTILLKLLLGRLLLTFMLTKPKVTFYYTFLSLSADYFLPHETVFSLIFQNRML
jgi:hypothetical protein